MTGPYQIYSRYKCAKQATSADVVEHVHLIDVQTYCIEEKKKTASEAQNKRGSTH